MTSAPSFHLVRAPLTRPALDIAAATDRALVDCGVRLRAGSEVAVALGSRGIAGLPLLSLALLL